MIIVSGNSSPPFLRLNIRRNPKFFITYTSFLFAIPSMEQGGTLSIYSHPQATKIIHLYYYNSRNPDDHNVYEWGSSSSGHFELLVPPAEGPSPHTSFTPRRGSDAKSRPSPQTSPAKPSAKKQCRQDKRLSQSERRMSTNRKRAAVRV